MKLSKREQKKQKEVLELLNKESLTHAEIEKIYTDLNEGGLGDVTGNSAYFTGLPLAYDFAAMAPTSGVVVDMCAGFGVLSYAALCRDTYEGRIKKIICIERDPKYIEVGKKLVQSITKEKSRTDTLTEVVWICGDMFDESLWKKIEAEHGKIDCIISNPPYGKISKTDYSRDWLKYKGAEMEMAAVEIGYIKADYASYILPQGSCTFRASGRYGFGGAEHVENRKVAALKKDMGVNFYMAWMSIDTTFEGYGDNFKNTKIVVECLTIDKEV
jgi:16S rRNA G966 N2-methylase RsmD